MVQHGQNGTNTSFGVKSYCQDLKTLALISTDHLREHLRLIACTVHL